MRDLQFAPRGDEECGGEPAPSRTSLAPGHPGPDGGPPHRSDLLEPIDPQIIQTQPAEYDAVLNELERGIQLVMGRPVRRQTPGWLGIECDDEEMAIWLLRAIIVENVMARREEKTLYFPVSPEYQLEKEIKNVITVIAKTNHYWEEHLLEKNASP